MKTSSSEEFRNIALTKICPNPWNTRTRFSGQKFDELVTSIRQKGVLQPILVRPIEDGPRLVDNKRWPNQGGLVEFEIVAGERRFRARYQVAAENGGPEAATIPAIVKSMSDDEAFDATTIENAQREDLTELEEARNFQNYLKRKGPDAVEELSSRTGIHPAYIRRRVRVLALPKSVLQAWDGGKLKYGHLEQLCRLQGAKEIAEWVKKIEGDQWRGPLSVRELKDRIDNASPALGGAFFDLEKEGCLACPHNSEVQHKLFAVDQSEQAHCDNPKCFKQRQNNWLLANWEKSALRKKYRTNGFLFFEAFSHQTNGVFHGAKEVFGQCKKCDRFVTVMQVDGGVRFERACMDDACKQKLAKERSRLERVASVGKSAGEAGDGTEVQGPPPPRVAWHGEHFREIFYRQKIRERTEFLPMSDQKLQRILLFAMIAYNSEVLGAWFARRHGLKSYNGEPVDEADYFILDKSAALELIAGMDINLVLEDIGDAAIELVLTEAYRAAVSASQRRAIGDMLGIDLAAEWRITEEYLAKKTTGEMLGFGMQSGIFENPAALAFLKETLGRKSFSACKKAELVRVFLESGADLAGKVPNEILAGGAA